MFRENNLIFSTAPQNISEFEWKLYTL